MILGRPNNDFGGTKRVFGPHKRNLRGENNDFGGTNDLEFEGTKPGFWVDQTLILGGPTECLSLPNFHFLVNLGLKKYNNTLLATLLKYRELHPLVPQPWLPWLLIFRPGGLCAC